MQATEAARPSTTMRRAATAPPAISPARWLSSGVLSTACAALLIATSVTAVAVAGGFTYRAVQGYGEVVRATRGVATTGKVTSNTFLAPGDVVQVLERYF